MPSQSKEDTYAYYYHTNYIRNARAIAIAWAIFTFCFAIIMVVVFVQPYWIGDAPDALGTGYFGLYSGCISVGLQGNLQCTEKGIFDFSQILGPKGNTYLLVATTLVGIAVICTLLSILLMLLFLCKVPNTATVFTICGALQILTGVCLLIGILVFPAGWEGNSRMEMLCGADISYSNRSGCQLRWVFYLAIIAVFDAIILGVLALILANKQDKLHEDMHFSDYYQPKGKHSEKKKRSQNGTYQPSLFNSYPTHASETYVRDGQTISNGNAASLDRRSVGSTERAASAASDQVRARGDSRHTGSDSADRRSNGAPPSDTRSGDRGGEEPSYAAVTPRSQRSNKHGSTVEDHEDDGHSTHSTRSARSGHSKASTKSGKSGRAHDVVY